MGHLIGKGRSARETYPRSPAAGGGGSGSAFASNAASGPASLPNDVVPLGTLVPWSAIASGATPTVAIPIHPAVTGRMRISGSVGIVNASVDALPLSVQLVIDGTTFFGTFQQATLETAGTSEVQIPFLYELFEGASLSLGAHTIGIIVKSVGSLTTANIRVQTCSIDIQELPAATG